jgi:GNAT superfamily N-acetyltransferase
MARRLVPLRGDAIADLVAPCGTCVIWELGPAGVRHPPADPVAAKLAWFDAATSEAGPCGLLLLVDGEVAGHAVYAPAAFVPQATAFPTSPPAAGSALPMSLRVRGDRAGQGLGRVLVQGAVRDLAERGVRSLEAFAANGPAAGSSRGPGPVLGAGNGAGDSAQCVLPVGFLAAVGFVAVREHPRWPRMRLDLGSTVAWREEVGGALGRLVGAVRPEPAVRPVWSEPSVPG